MASLGAHLSLNGKICLAATLLVVLSLGITATVIGIKSSRSAEAAAMQLARTSAREVAGALQSRIATNLASIASMAEATASLADVRNRGIARVVNTLLPGVAGFCAPVFDADGHLALGMVAVGSLATFDVDWNGAIATPLKAAATQLSADLGYRRA